MSRRFLGGVLAVLVAAAGGMSAEAGDRSVAGTIVAYECGDNCYLTIATAKGEELTGLCVAKACEPWNEVAEMPEKYVGKKVTVTLGMAKQFDGSGNVMGEMDAFTAISFK
ncbi:MAG: hypothetical protein R3D02_00610 [Hyphomicrobiales bacterium]